MSETRQAKYCPQCGTMARIEAPLCQTCGHQFHTGVPEPVLPEDDDEFNKTQLFMMSPVLMHRAPEVVPPLPVEDLPVMTRRPSRRLLMLGLGTVLLLAVLIWGGQKLLGPPPKYPNEVIGRWTRATASGTVGLMFAADGSGALFWQPVAERGAGEPGDAALHWQQTPKGMLKFSGAAEATSGPEVQQSVQLLESRPLSWSADSHTLTLGKLTFVRQGQ